MIYKNASRILAYVCLISITCGTHIDQEKNQKGPEETIRNKNVNKLKAEPLNIKRDKEDISENVDQQDSSNPEQTKSNSNEDPESDINEVGSDLNIKKEEKGSSCWMSLEAKRIFEIMDEIDNRYAAIRKAIHDEMMSHELDQKMLKTFLFSGGAAVRDFYENEGHRHTIPAGLNLGGYCMMRMPDSLLFFHRIKLRDNTWFRVLSVNHNMANMVMTWTLSLNDLHLRGAYERSVTDTDPSVLFYAPSYGEIGLLLKNVVYKMEARFRLVKERLAIEVQISELQVPDILMTYINGGTETLPIKVDKENIAEFLDRLKTDLDKWLKDFFNDFWIYLILGGLKNLDELEKYDKEKAIALNEYMDHALDLIRKRIHERKAAVIKLPKFTILGVNGFQINLNNGMFRGLDSIYRRSVATTNTYNDVRKVDAIVGFSNLKVTYQYEAVIPTGLPPVVGMLTLSANELSAHLSLSMVKEPETVDIDIDFMDLTKPESLTVQGSANIMISNFKHLLEHHIIAIMSNTLAHGIKILRYLPKCEPFLPGQIFLENYNRSGQNTMSKQGKKLKMKIAGNFDNNVAPQTESETDEVENGPFLLMTTKTPNLRKSHKGSKKKSRSYKKKNKHNKKKTKSSKTKDRGNKKKKHDQ